MTESSGSDLAERRQELLEQWWQDDATPDMRQRLLDLQDHQQLPQDVVDSLVAANTGAVWVELQRERGEVTLRALTPLEEFLAQKRESGA